MSTGLQEHLAELIAEARVAYWRRQTDRPSRLDLDQANFIAERLASAFQQVGFDSGDALYPMSWATNAVYSGWRPVYRFARPEHSEEGQ